MKKSEYQLFRSYLSLEFIDKIRNKIFENQSFFRLIPDTKLKTNLPYRIFDGEEVRKVLPELVEFAKGPIQKLAEEFAEQKLSLMDDLYRGVRFHYYTTPKEGLLWHVDEAHYTVMITIMNESEGGTQIFSLTQSRFLVWLVYPLWFFQKLFLLFSPEKCVPAVGDLLIIAGGKAVHRGFNIKPGRRLILAISYNSAEQKESWIRSVLIKRYNVTVKRVSDKKTYGYNFSDDR